MIGEHDRHAFQTAAWPHLEAAIETVCAVDERRAQRPLRGRRGTVAARRYVPGTTPVNVKVPSAAA